jgi:outer membrane protein assembly factor BamB
LLICAALLSGCANQPDHVINQAAPISAETMVAYISYSGGVWGLHGRDGAQAWHTSSDPIRDTSVVGGVLYAATGTIAPLASAIVALRLSDGSQLWRTSIPEAEVSLSADSASVLVAASKTDAAGLYALNPVDGAIRWRAAGSPDGRPSAGGGVVVANLLRDPNTGAGGLTAFRESDGALLWQKTCCISAATNQIGAYGTVGDDSNALALRDGRPLWDYQSGLTMEGGGADNYHGDVVAVSARLALVRVQFPVVSYDLPSRDYLLALDAQTGQIRWRSPQAFGAFDSGPVFDASGAMIYGWRSGELIALNSDDGEEAWRTKVPDYQQGLGIGLFALDGALFAMIEPPPCYGGLFGCQPSSNRLLALDGATGAICWWRDFSTGTALAQPASALRE